MAEHSTVKEESNENPARGTATWVTPDTMEGTKLTVNVVDVATVDAVRAMAAGTVVCATFASSHLAVAEVPTVLSLVPSTLVK